HRLPPRHDRQRQLIDLQLVAIDLRVGGDQLGNALLRRRALLVAFELADSVEPVVRLIEKYSDVPMSLADACLVRMTETLADPVILTTDQDFRVYRRHSRQVVPCMTPE